MNGYPFLENFNISQEYGYATAVKKTIKVYLEGGKGLNLDFTPINGKPVLNALSLRKLN
ncbi:hypothetical protein D3C78_1667740 [compost metagenome]